MPDYRALFDRDYIYAFDLGGKDVTVTITKVIGGTLTSPGGRKTKKPVLFFEGKERGLALNKTNSKTIAALYGNNTDAWLGKQITLFPTTTMFGDEQRDCIRVRNRVPNGAAAKKEEPASEGAPNGSA